MRDFIDSGMTSPGTLHTELGPTTNGQNIRTSSLPTVSLESQAGSHFYSLIPAVPLFSKSDSCIHFFSQNYPRKDGKWGEMARYTELFGNSRFWSLCGGFLRLRTILAISWSWKCQNYEIKRKIASSTVRESRK